MPGAASGDSTSRHARENGPGLDAESTGPGCLENRSHLTVVTFFAAAHFLLVHRTITAR